MDSRSSMDERVLFEILVRLPVVSLLRFKTVCKSWFALIESSMFVAQHLHLHSGKGTLIAFYLQKYESGVGFLFRLHSGNKYEVNTDLDFEEQWYTTIGYRFDLVDSCNGIICLHNNWTGDVALWNPALKQLRHVPKSSIDKRYKGGYVMGDLQSSCIGFGYDAKTNDYKVVKISWCLNKPDYQVEVYSLRSSFWKVIHKNDALPFTFIEDARRVHATSRDGICFWAGGGDNKKVNLLVSFDLKDEVFETMSLPDDQHHGVPYVMDFRNDKLVYIKGFDKGQFDIYNECFEIWVLHEFGVKKSWNKTHKIGPLCGPHYLLRIIGFSKNGDILILPLYPRQLHLCNLVTQKVYPSNPVEHNAYFIHALHYNESLVSIK